MALGSITSLGVGSGLELQDILDQLKEVDETSVNLQKTEKQTLEDQVAEFDSLNAKLIQMKSSALSLSLESNFLERSANTSDEEVLTASVISGTQLGSYDLEVLSLASKSSFQSIGFEEEDAIMISSLETGIESASEAAVTETTNISFTVGQGEEQKAISLAVPADASLNDIAEAINATDENLNEDGSTIVTATVESSENGLYIRLAATEENTLENNQILMSESPSFIAPDTVFSYQVGSTTDPIYVPVAANTTYAELVSQINEDSNNSGMTAKLINDGSEETPWHLTFTANETGEGNRIRLNGISMTEIQGSESSLNASFTMDGYEYQRQSNDHLDDVIQGVTLNFEKTGEAKLNIASDMEGMKDKIVDIIEIFNELVTEISKQTSYDSEEESTGVLARVYSVKTLGSDLASLLTTGINTGTDIGSLQDLGLELNRDGTLTLDESTLGQAFSGSAEDVAKLFIGDTESGLTGMGDLLNDRLKEMTSSSGSVSSEKSAAEEKIERLTTDIETAEERLNQKYELMARDFVRLDALIGTLNSQSKYLASVIDSFNNSSNS